MSIASPKYAICAGHRETAQAAAKVLDQGGNAVDAAVASMWMMMLAEPCMASAGAGGFAMIDWAGKTTCLDFFCQTPQVKRPAADLDFYPITVDFGGTTEDFYVGRGAAATPGMLAGIFAMHERYGRMPMTELASITVEASKAGVLLDRFQAYDWLLLRDIFAIEPSVRSIFFKPDGSLKLEGDLVQMPVLGDAVEVLAREGSRLFYCGEMAEQIAADMLDSGTLSRADLADYQVYWRDPLTLPYRGHYIHSTPAPSVGGALITAYLLAMQDSKAAPDLAGVEASRLTKALAEDDTALSEYLHSHGLSHRTIHTAHKWGGTSHFNVVDGDRNAVAVTISLGEGNGYFVPGTGMQMNNMLGEAALLPAGYHSWEEDVRLRSMMTPTIVQDASQQLRLALGSGGAGRIPQMIAQVIDQHLRNGESLSEAVDLPRHYYDGEMLQLEPGATADSSGQPTNQWTEQSLYFGGVQAISASSYGLSAVPDHRRYGYGIVRQ